MDTKNVCSLPVRPRSINDRPVTPSEASVCSRQSNSSSVGSSQPSPASSIYSNSDVNDEDLPGQAYLSTPGISSGRASFQFHPGDGTARVDGHEFTFTFRSLHNTTPLPTSIESKEPIWSFDALHSNQPATEKPVTPSSLVVPQQPIVPTPEAVTSPINHPYDVRDETSPPTLFFSPVFQVALQNGIKIANDTSTAISKASDNARFQGDLERLLDDAKRLRTFESSDTRTIAVLGDSGQGKSSLINSLLHFPEIAKTGDIGAACTSVVTEYRHKTKNHTAPITIEVEYLSNLEIEELITELLWKYRQLYLPEVEDDKVDAKEYARYQRESEQAWSALEAAFKHQGSFTKSLLQDMSEGALERVTQRLIEWAREIEWPEGRNTGKWKSTANTAEECCEKTSVFMKNRLWPFTKIIRVYLGAQVLKTGIVLADLPGLQDTNLARVRATQTYLMKCDHVFIVANICRAITDQSLKSSLYSVLARHVPLEWEESGGKSLNVAVVCTKSEEINVKTARRDLCGPGKRVSQTIIDQLDKEIQLAKQRKDRKAQQESEQSYGQLLTLMQARNDHVKEGLQNAYAEKVSGSKLEVFCVSNKMYETYTEDGDGVMVQSSGIPELRQFCHRITADAQLLEAQHFLQSMLASLLNSVDLWNQSVSATSQAGSVDDAGLIYDALEEAQEETLGAIEDSKLRFYQDFKEIFLTLLQNRNAAWEHAARVKGSTWESWHWTQYNAWCINNGNHYTQKRGAVNWNAELIWKMRMELEYQWDLVEEEIPEMFQRLLLAIKTPMLKLQSVVQDHGLSSAVADGIEFRIRDVEYNAALVQQEFQRETRLICLKASEPNSASYILSEMIPAYRSAAQEYGTGKAARQRNTVQGRITNGTLIPNISYAIRQNMDDLTESKFLTLREKVDGVIELIRKDLDMALASHVQPGNGRVNEIDSKTGEELAMGIARLKMKHGQVLASIETLS